MQYQVEIAEVDSRRVAAVKLTTNLTAIGADIWRGFDMLMEALIGAGTQPAGAPVVVYHSMIDANTEGDIEVCVPVVGEVGSDPEVYTRELEGGTVATTVHHGPYPDIAAAYGAVMSWITQKGYPIVGPPREIYLNDPQEVAPDDLLTRIEFPVAVVAG